MVIRHECQTHCRVELDDFAPVESVDACLNVQPNELEEHDHSNRLKRWCVALDDKPDNLFGHIAVKAGVTADSSAIFLVRPIQKMQCVA